MVVDDDPAICRVFQRYIARKGGRTLIASNGEQALEIIKTAPIHLILLDAYMPQMNGMEFLKRLEKPIAVPVIMITAADDLAVVKEALALGVRDFIKKPIDLEYLDQSESWKSWFKD